MLAAALFLASQYVVTLHGDSNSESPSQVPSVTTAWPDTLAATIGGAYTVINHAVSGEQIRPTMEPGGCTPHPAPCRLASKYCPSIASDDPTHLVIMEGTNDLGTPAATASMIMAILEPILESAYHNQNLVVVFVSVPPRGGSFGPDAVTKQQNLDDTNAAVAAWVAAHPGSFYVDTYSLLDANDDDILDAGYNDGDNLHMNQAGHDLIAATVAACGAFP